MSLPHEQAHALVRTREFLFELCVPSKSPRVPRRIREQARRCLKHYPISMEWPRIVRDDFAMKQAEELEDFYFKQRW